MIDTNTSTPAPIPLLIDAKAACEFSGLKSRKLWSLTACNAIPSRKIGASRRYVPAELIAWIDAGCPTEPGAGDRIKKVVSRER